MRRCSDNFPPGWGYSWGTGDNASRKIESALGVKSCRSNYVSSFIDNHKLRHLIKKKKERERGAPKGSADKRCSFTVVRNDFQKKVNTDGKMEK